VPHRAGIDKAEALAVVTNSDDSNVVIALLAPNFFGVPRVVTHVYDPQQMEIYGRLGLQTVSPTDLGIEQLVALVTYSELTEVLTLGSGEMQIVWAEIPAVLLGRPVNALAVIGEISVSALCVKAGVYPHAGRRNAATRSTAWLEIDREAQHVRSDYWRRSGRQLLGLALAQRGASGQSGRKPRLAAMLGHSHED
jgi:hypothetical protein